VARALLALLACAALVACARPAPSPPAPPASPPAPAATAAVEITGRLTRKGPAETSFWAVTDASGRIFQIVDVSPALDARLQEIQNRDVTLRVEPRGKLLVDQVKVVEIVRPAP
jgi:hypothetical protein